MASWKLWIVLLLVLMVGGGTAVGWQRHTEKQTQAAQLLALAAAREAMASGDVRHAESLLSESIDLNGATTAEALVMLARARAANGRADLAMSLWDDLEKRHPDHPYRGEMLLARAENAMRQQEWPVAMGFIERLATEAGTSPEAAKLPALRLAVALASGTPEEALEQAETVIADASADPVARQQAEDFLGDRNVAALVERAAEEGDVYTVASGDFIQRIAKRYNVTQELLMRVNGITDPKMLSVGQRLVIPKASFSLAVDKNTNTMTVYNHGQFFKKYRVRTGKTEHMTPQGEFTIINKKVNPEWRKPGTGEYLGPNDPQNELGTRWMAFVGSSLGIHGTIKPETIGYNTSQGCVGMLQEDVEELFDLLPLGTTLSITGETNPELAWKE